MSEAGHLSKLRYTFIVLLIFGLSLPSAFAEQAVSGNLEKSDFGDYQEIHDQNIFYELTSYLHFDRLYRAISHKKTRADHVNAFDEVPDNSLFANRHFKKRLTSDELRNGPQETSGPDTSGMLTVIQAKFLDSAPASFFVKDGHGDIYEFRFDPFDALELITSSEVIASRFYYAIGYNVLEYTIATFDADKLMVDPNATVVDNSGFEKKLTTKNFQNQLLFLPQDPDGKYRVSARKVIPGSRFGTLKFQNQREIRALSVFASWLNQVYLDRNHILEVPNTGKFYLADFASAFGALPDVAKPPMFGHEHFFDYGESLKAFFALGLWEKPWQKRWRESGEKINTSSATGYFDNRYFKPSRFKTQLPRYAFKDLSRADGFWAAKIIMSFTDDDIAEMIKAGKLLSHQEDVAYLAHTLSKRRDMIGEYWFSHSSPLDNFSFSDNKLGFEDLSVKYGFSKKEAAVYHVDIGQKNGNKNEIIRSFDASDSSFDLSNDLNKSKTLDVTIQLKSSAGRKSNPFVSIGLRDGKITEIIHED